MRRGWTAWTRAPAPSLVALAVLAVAGCGGGSHRARHAVRAKAAGPPTVMHLKLADDPSTPISAEVPSRPIAYTPTTIPGVELELFTLRRASPNAVLAVFALQISSSATSDNSIGSEVVNGLSANPGAFSAVSGVSLLDQAGLKEYETFMADPTRDATCLCTVVNNGELDQAGTHYYAALLAAPPAGVTTVSFVTQLGTIASAPLSG